MSCSYRVGGVENALLTEVFNYVEDNPSGARAGFLILIVFFTEISRFHDVHIH